MIALVKLDHLTRLLVAWKMFKATHDVRAGGEHNTCTHTRELFDALDAVERDVDKPRAGNPELEPADAWLDAGSPVGALKRCPSCGSLEFEGAEECSTCGGGPFEDEAWRAATGPRLEP